jgi:transposase-like protein
MINAINALRKTGGFTPEPKPSDDMNRKYTDEYKLEALALQETLGSRNKAALQLGIAPSLITTFLKQKNEGRFNKVTAQ